MNAPRKKLRVGNVSKYANEWNFEFLIVINTETRLHVVKMPLTGHKKASKESSNGSAHSSPARSPDQLSHHSTAASIRSSNSAPSLTTSSLTRGDQHTYSSASSEISHSHSHQVEDRHCTVSTATGGHSLERTSSNSSTSSGYSTSNHQSHHHHSRPGVSLHHGHSIHHQHGPPTWGEKEKVALLVDGKRFSVSPHLLTKQPNTMLGR